VSASRAITYRWSLRRRLVVGHVIVAYLVAAIGFPLPAAASRGEGEAFPCQGHRCGCQSAEQCWRQCCCFSAEEHLVWARLRGVTPPECVAPPNPSGWRTQRLRDQAATTTDACCKRDASDEPAPGGRTCPIVSPLRCQGLTAIWAAATAGFAPPAISDWQPNWPLVGPVATAEFISRQLCSLPSTPPPRHVSG